jgi:hypothetical protein
MYAQPDQPTQAMAQAPALEYYVHTENGSMLVALPPDSQRQRASTAQAPYALENNSYRDGLQPEMVPYLQLAGLQDPMSEPLFTVAEVENEINKIKREQGGDYIAAARKAQATELLVRSLQHSSGMRMAAAFRQLWLQSATRDSGITEAAVRVHNALSGLEASRQKEPQQEVPMPPPSFGSHRQSLFTAVDANGDGIIDRSELYAAMHVGLVKDGRAAAPELAQTAWTAAPQSQDFVYSLAVPTAKRGHEASSASFQSTRASASGIGATDTSFQSTRAGVNSEDLALSDVPEHVQQKPIVVFDDTAARRSTRMGNVDANMATLAAARASQISQAAARTSQAASYQAPAPRYSHGQETYVIAPRSESPLPSGPPTVYGPRSSLGGLAPHRASAVQPPAPRDTITVTSPQGTTQQTQIRGSTFSPASGQRVRMASNATVASGQRQSNVGFGVPRTSVYSYHQEDDAPSAAASRRQTAVSSVWNAWGDYSGSDQDIPNAPSGGYSEPHQSEPRQSQTRFSQPRFSEPRARAESRRKTTGCDFSDNRERAPTLQGEDSPRSRLDTATTTKSTRSHSLPDATFANISKTFTVSDVARRPTQAAAALGVTKNAGRRTVAAAFYKGAKQTHPDKGGHKEDFQVIREAYAKMLNERR